jgi:hypothetical protein
VRSCMRGALVLSSEEQEAVSSSSFPQLPIDSDNRMYGQRQLAYAPTPYSYTPSSLSATINLDEVCIYLPYSTRLLTHL